MNSFPTGYIQNSKITVDILKGLSIGEIVEKEYIDREFGKLQVRNIMFIHIVIVELWISTQ